MFFGVFSMLGLKGARHTKPLQRNIFGVTAPSHYCHNPVGYTLLPMDILCLYTTAALTKCYYLPSLRGEAPVMCLFVEWSLTVSVCYSELNR